MLCAKVRDCRRRVWAALFNVESIRLTARRKSTATGSAIRFLPIFIGSITFHDKEDSSLPSSTESALFEGAAWAHGKGVGATRMAGGSFSVADILMADVLRLIDRFDGLVGYPACRDYV